MKTRISPRPEILVLAWAALALAASACVASPDPPSTTIAPEITRPVPTTTQPARCPDLFCVIYRIRPDAVWSDGVPVTSADFIRTYELQASSPGYSLVTGSEAPDEKTITFAFSQPYGPWQSLFRAVVPAHVDDPTAVSAGAFTLGRTGEEVVLFRNPEYGAPGEIESVRFVKLDGVRDGLERLRSGEIDVFFPPAVDWVVAELGSMENVEFAVGPGPLWEHIDFNLADPLLGQEWVRRVINLAFDPDRFVEENLRGVDPETRALLSAVWPQNTVHYFPRFPAEINPDLARQSMADHGCALGDDGVFVCDGIRMSFKYATTIGDPWRMSLFELFRDSLADVGIEVVGEFLAPSDLFAADFLFGGPDIWQIISFPWAFSADPGLGDTRFICEGDAPSGFGSVNVNRFCDPVVESLVFAARTEIDPARRAELYSEADGAYLRQVPIIPIFQRPVIMAWAASLDGPVAPSLAGISSWSGLGEVTVGVDIVPTEFDLLHPGDTDLILGLITAGSFTIDDSLVFVPVLIEDAETIMGSP